MTKSIYTATPGRNQASMLAELTLLNAAVSAALSKWDGEAAAAARAAAEHPHDSILLGALAETLRHLTATMRALRRRLATLLRRLRACGIRLRGTVAQVTASIITAARGITAPPAESRPESCARTRRTDGEVDHARV